MSGAASTVLTLALGLCLGQLCLTQDSVSNHRAGTGFGCVLIQPEALCLVSLRLSHRLSLVPHSAGIW